MKIFESTYFNATHVIAPARNLLFTNRIKWEDRNPLLNLERFNPEESHYTSNAPQNEALKSTEFERHQAFIFHSSLRWQANHTYTRMGDKFHSKSDDLAITISYTAAFAGRFNSDVDYSKLQLKLEDQYGWALLGKGKVLLEAGTFLSKDSLSFVDFNHFNGNRVPYTTFSMGNFQLLDYYQYSTSGAYFKAHVEHKIHAMTIGKGPLHIDPVLSVNYLRTNKVNFVELGIGIDRILNNWRLDFYAGFKNGTYESHGIRFSFSMQ